MRLGKWSPGTVCNRLFLIARIRRCSSTPHRGRPSTANPRTASRLPHMWALRQSTHGCRRRVSMMRPTKKTLRSPSCSLTAASGTVLLPRGGDAGLRVLLSLAVPEGEEVDSEPQVDCPVATLVHAGQTSSSGFGALSHPEQLSGLIRGDCAIPADQRSDQHVLSPVAQGRAIHPRGRLAPRAGGRGKNFFMAFPDQVPHRACRRQP